MEKLAGAVFKYSFRGVDGVAHPVCADDPQDTPAQLLDLSGLHAHARLSPVYSLHAGLVAAGTDKVGDVAGRAGFSALRIMVSLPARVTTRR